MQDPSFPGTAATVIPQPKLDTVENKADFLQKRKPRICVGKMIKGKESFSFLFLHSTYYFQNATSFLFTSKLIKMACTHTALPLNVKQNEVSLEISADVFSIRLTAVKRN